MGQALPGLGGEGYENCELQPQKDYDDCGWGENVLLEDGLTMQVGTEVLFNRRKPLLDEAPVRYEVVRYGPPESEPESAPEVQFTLTFDCRDEASTFDGRAPLSRRHLRWCLQPRRLLGDDPRSLGVIGVPSGLLWMASLLVGCGPGGGDASSASSVATTSSPASTLGSFVEVPAGSFVMGASPMYPEEGAAMRVHVSGFLLKAHEVTNAEF
ncbi:MAG: formylglycine-generating enzyme family protein, partial [Actinomycetia bacterium]|nr:formylglycine-generating enzyme family protein [Actinomycetes bacterium]